MINERKGRLSEEGAGVWTNTEHNRFLEAMELFPKGPWKLVAKYVGTRNARQTMTHAQKFRQKIERHQRGLRTKRRKAAAHDSTDDDDSECSTPDRPPVKSTAPTLLPLLYDSPKDVSGGMWLSSYGLLLESHLGATTGGGSLWSSPCADVSSLHSPLPLSELETRVPCVGDVDPQAVWFDDCLDYFIDSFS